MPLIAFDPMIRTFIAEAFDIGFSPASLRRRELAVRMAQQSREAERRVVRQLDLERSRLPVERGESGARENDALDVVDGDDARRAR